MPIPTLETLSFFIAKITFGLLGASWVYAIAAFQVLAGLPPFYVDRRRQLQPNGYPERTAKFLRRNSIFMALSVIAIFLDGMAGNGALSILGLLISALCAFLFGFRQRQFLKAELPLLGKNANGYPMLAFDVWTIGLALFFFLLIVFV